MERRLMVMKMSIMVMATPCQAERQVDRGEEKAKKRENPLLHSPLHLLLSPSLMRQNSTHVIPHVRSPW